jgi:helix-turn-helix protein
VSLIRHKCISMYEEIVLKKLDELKEKMDTLLETQKSNVKLPSEWIDKEETMKILKCSERTLQTLRDDDLLPFSPPFGGSKFFYKRSDILKLLESGVCLKYSLLV